ncbi:hypothetical protein F443_09503 [Phytophthora nicotianae P1569]|uniref:BED-type domain-containing protein n=2 Tax=Phytophthora nicotianae TaxID=4792 RepID=V9F3K0_PHYNI|nr:hypothetical protein F443_09503 [Phytophthora nicotianae P1569]
MTPDRAPIADQRRTIPAAPSPPSAARSARSWTSPFRSPPGFVLRRSPRYSPYCEGIPFSSPSSQQLNSPPVTQLITFSPQPRTITPSRPPRSPAPPRSSRASPLRTGRPRNDIWDNYYIEKENGKKHGRCKYCVNVPSRRKLSGVLLNHVRQEVHLNVLDLINEQDYVSLVTDGWSDINGASIITFMVVAPGMPSLFWSCSAPIVPGEYRITHQ